MGVLQSPDPPYNGFCFKKLAQKLCEMEVPQYCELHSMSTDRYYSPRIKKCDGVKRPLEAKIKELEQQLSGLTLKKHKDLLNVGSVQ